MRSEENGIWKWLNENLAKILIGCVINMSVRLNQWQVAVESRDKAITEPAISIVVIPCGGLRNVVQHSGEYPDIFHARSAFNSFLN